MDASPYKDEIANGVIITGDAIAPGKGLGGKKTSKSNVKKK
jgi:hypothetical protein